MMFHQLLWHPLAQLTHKINHHSSHIWRLSLVETFILDLTVWQSAAFELQIFTMKADTLWSALVFLEMT